MHLKSYFAATVEAAIQRARRELGDEALLMNSRPTEQANQHLGTYEVVFALPAAPPPPAPSIQEPPGPRLTAAPELPPSHVLRTVLEEVEKIKSAMARAGAFSISASTIVREPELAGIFWALLDADFLPEDAMELVVAAARQSVRDSSGAIILSKLQTALQDEIRKNIQVTTTGNTNVYRSQTKVSAFVGPAGAGKTSSLVKIAMNRGLKSRRPMQLLSLDAVRVGAAEQLRTYAMILGVGFQECATPQLLEQGIEEHRHKDWIWIDTPGLSAHDRDTGRDLAAFFTAHPEIEVYLVLSAAMKTADLIHAAGRYSIFRPARLLLTHMDETESYGALYTIPMHFKKPLAFLSFGQRIPEDIETADAGRVLELLMQRIWMQAPKPALFPVHASRAAAGL